MLELRFVQRASEVQPQSSDIGVQSRTVKILQQRIKSGTYGVWGEWHDIPLGIEVYHPEEDIDD